MKVLKFHMQIITTVLLMSVLNFFNLNFWFGSCYFGMEYNPDMLHVHEINPPRTAISECACDYGYK